MKYVKLFEGFKEDEIQAICKKYSIKNYTINPDGSIDVDDDVYLEEYHLKELPKFGKVNGDFACYGTNLVTLKGSPKVSGFFSCADNNLSTLEGAPTYIYDYFSCADNNLSTLEGAPNYIVGDFYCNDNNILTFEGAPNYIGGDFYCNTNPIYCIWDLFRDYSKVELLNDYDALRVEEGQSICILSRLNGFLKDIGRPELEDVQIKVIEKFYKIR